MAVKDFLAVYENTQENKEVKWYVSVFLTSDP